MRIYRAPPTPPAGLSLTSTHDDAPDTLRGDTAVRGGEPSRRVVQRRTDRQASASATGVTVCELGDA
jgi:hypothetical protein